MTVLTDIDADRDDDGTINVRWLRGPDTVTLVCTPDGTLTRVVSPYRPAEPPLSSHVLALSESFPHIVRRFSLAVENGRSLLDVFEHMNTEADELAAEIAKVSYGEEEGEDGVVGEAIDVMLCALDMIYRHKPTITEGEINAIALRKCEKWKRKEEEGAYKK